MRKYFLTLAASLTGAKAYDQPNFNYLIAGLNVLGFSGPHVEKLENDFGPYYSDNDKKYGTCSELRGSSVACHGSSDQTDPSTQKDCKRAKEIKGSMSLIDYNRCSKFIAAWEKMIQAHINGKNKVGFQFSQTRRESDNSSEMVCTSTP